MQSEGGNGRSEEGRAEWSGRRRENLTCETRYVGAKKVVTCGKLPGNVVTD